MFPTVKNFILYFSIFLYTYALPLNGNKPENTDTDLEQEVQREHILFQNLITELKKPGSDQDKIEGKIWGKLDSLIRRARMVDQLLENKGEMKTLEKRATKVETLMKEIGVLETKMDRSDMYQLILALTFRVDTVEKILAPGEELKGQRSTRWIYIFKKNTPAVEDVRSKVYAAGMTERSFAEQVERLIQQRNNLVGYANVPLPYMVSDKTIEGALQIMEITQDKNAVETIKILVAPVQGCDFEPSTPKPE